MIDITQPVAESVDPKSGTLVEFVDGKLRMVATAEHTDKVKEQLFPAEWEKLSDTEKIEYLKKVVLVLLEKVG